MAPTIKELALQAIMARLNTNRPGDVVVYGRCRVIAIDPTQLKSNVVYMGGSPYPLDEEVERVGGHSGPLVKRQPIVTVEHRAKGDGVAPLDSISDPDVAWTIQALAGSSVDGLWRDIRERGEKIEYAQADYGYCLRKVFFELWSQSKTADPTTYA